jgi:putative redox protein
MASFKVEYEGDLHCRAIHGPSGTELSTDAPVENGGSEKSLSPTDLVAVALGTCILTTMAFRAKSLGLDLAGASVNVDKEMATAPIRRIARLATTVRIPGQITDRHKKVLEATAHSCPVHKSLSHEIEMPIEFSWDSAEE